VNREIDRSINCNVIHCRNSKSKKKIINQSEKCLPILKIKKFEWVSD